MRANERVRLVGKKTVLVPYEKHHVHVYHEWMKDPQIRELTASEQLSLDEEFAMQKTWREDEDKLTFIVLDRERWERHKGAENREEKSMIGDVNLFLNDESAEVEVMIADATARGRGLGREAVNTIIAYAAAHLNLGSFSAKIGFDNDASLGLFEKLGFKRVSESHVFREHTLKLSDEGLARCKETLKNVHIQDTSPKHQIGNG